MSDRDPYAPYPPFPPYPAYAPYPPYPAYPPIVIDNCCCCPTAPAAAPASSGATQPSSAPAPSSSSSSSSAPSSSSSSSASSSSSSSSSLSHVSGFNVIPLKLGPVAGIHEGTGTHSRTQLVAVPSSVPGSANLVFASQSVQVTTMLYAITQNVVPNWFGVAVPRTITDFTKPNIFFHPTPAQAGYKDSDYPTKTGKWPQLFYYMEHLGYQVDAAIQYYGAAQNQIVIMPFMTEAATNGGILPVNWFGIITDILTDVRTAIGGGSGTVNISEVVVSSFSAGFIYSENFRGSAAGLGPLLKQVWDLDGFPKADSSALLTTASVTAVKYDEGSEPGSIHVPLSRWAAYPTTPPNPGDPKPPKNGSDVHQDIRDFMYTHAATKR